MSKKLFAIAALPALLVSSAAMAADLGTDVAPAAAPPVFTLTGTAGVVGFNLPSFDPGYFGHSFNGTLIGGMIGANLSGVVGHQGDRDVVIGLSMFGAWATGTSTFTDTPSGTGTVTITGLTAPAGGSGPTTVNVTGTTAGSSAVTLNNPQGGNATQTVTSGGGGVQNIGAVQPAGTGTGFILSNVADSGSAAGSAAYGAAADSSGGVFIGAGDLTGLNITTKTTRSIGYGGGDVTIGLNGQVNDTTQLLFYGGPSVRLLSETDQTDVTVNMPTTPPSVVTFPNFGILGTDQLNSTYLGGVLGTSVAIQASPGVQLSLGGEAGLYDVMASWAGKDTYTTCCGNFSGVPGATSPSLSVTSDQATHSFDNTFGYALRGNGGVSFDIGGNKTITLGANAEYLSKVAQVTHGSQGTINIDNSTTTASFDSSTSTLTTAPTFSWGSMINYGASLSLTGKFD